MSACTLCVGRGAVTTSASCCCVPAVRNVLHRAGQRQEAAITTTSPGCSTKCCQKPSCIPSCQMLGRQVCPLCLHEIYLPIFLLLSHSSVSSGLSLLLKMHARVLTHFLSPCLSAFSTKPILKHHILLSSPFFDYSSR